MIKFVTWGPDGSNHQFATQRYIDALGLHGRASIELVDDFEQGAAFVLSKHADHLVQCAVHPQTATVVAKYRQGLYVMDVFISCSRDLAIVRNREANHPRTLALMEPTRGYIDLSRWSTTVLVANVTSVAEGLRDGRFEAGITYASVAAEDPDRFVIDEVIGSVDDAWLIYGRTRVTHGELLTWTDSPAARLMRQKAANAEP
jgi:hypothetical protein